MRTLPMKSRRELKLQRGQAVTEFVAAMALFLPLIMGVIYVFKYGDIKHQAVQASRYAAMERALDPHAQESDLIIKNETVARFFRDGAQSQIGFNDAATATTSGDENPNWSQMGGAPMIAQYPDVAVKLRSESVDSPVLAPINAATNLFNGLNGGFGTRADVEVPLANVAHFQPLSNINITIGASTVIAGDPWNGGGAANVAGHQTFKSVPGKIISWLNSIPGGNLLFEWLADTPAPQFGCVKPDVVPAAAAPGAQYNPQDNPTSPSNPNDQCY
jgi:hypothetical protein